MKIYGLIKLFMEIIYWLCKHFYQVMKKLLLLEEL